MKNRIKELIEARPELQFSKDNADSKVMSLFGDENSFSVGMGMGRKLGKRPSFMNAKNKFGQSRFVQARMGV